jgi:signal recognition particle GTPase
MSNHVPGPQQLRQQEKHEQKLKDIREQVAQGKLVIRKMTAEERRRYPPREADRRRRDSRRRS